MPKDLYLTLVNGRTIHVTNDWDGMEPTYEGLVDATGAPDDGKGIEAGEYYRDIHRYNAQVWPAQGSLTVTGSAGSPGGIYVGSTSSAPVTVQAALVPSTTLAAETVAVGYSSSVGSSSTTTTKGLVPDSVTAEPSDEVAKAKPRTWQKVCTWLVFNCTTTGEKRKWRAASVDGYSDQPPIDD